VELSELVVVIVVVVLVVVIVMSPSGNAYMGRHMPRRD